MEVKRQARAIATQCRLLDAAREVFGREGFHGASVADVARAAGDSKGALYHHFAAKEDLLLALLDERIEDLESRFADQPATAATTGAAADYAATLRTSEDGACNGRARGQRPDQRPRHRAPRRRRRRAGRVDRG